MDFNAKSANTTSSSSSSNGNSSNNVTLEQQIVTPASIDSIESSSGAATATTSSVSVSVSVSASVSTHHCYWSSVSTASDMCSCDSQINATTSAIFATGNGKRKRRSSSTKDPELGFEPPSAKRQQRSLAAVYGSDQSNQSSVASSVYTSPLTATEGDALSAQELLSIRSSPAEELSSASPASPPSPLPDSPDSPPSPDRGNKQLPIVVRYAATTVVEKQDDEVLDDSSEDYSYEDDDDDIDDDEDEEINSSSASPASSTATGCSQNGERTPATQQQQQPQISGGNRTVKLNPLDGATGHNNYKCMSPALEETSRPCPLPALSWANADDVWRRMCKRDEQDSHLRSSSMLDQHPGLQPRMRAILLDWLNEVCEVYKLHRDTFYLAVDYLDRYLYGQREVLKTHLQLIGITCLFVAAKVEEIYPPKIGEFAYVTDGACAEHDILQHEKILLQALGWDICPITVTGWLGVYMQLNVNNRTPASLTNIGKQAAGVAAGAGQVDDAFIYPQFSGFEFVQTSQLLDLCTLDVGMANYPYSVLAAAAISHTFNRETALRCSGLDWLTIQPCARWMEPFFHVISKKAPYLHLNEQNEQVTNKWGLAHICPNIVTDDSHIIQTHTTTMDMYDELLMAQNALHAMRARTQASPATALRAPESLLTPPASSHKPDEFLGDEDEVVAETVTARSTATCTAVGSSSNNRLVSHKNSSSSNGSENGNGSCV